MELAAVRLTEGLICKALHRSRCLQPLRQKSEIFATSPYTGEALPLPAMRCAPNDTASGEQGSRMGTSSTRRKNVHGRVASMHVSGQMGFPAGRGWTQPELARAGGHARPAWPRAGWALRRLSRAGRGPGSGCAAARGRGPGAGCRRHSPGRGSAAGCAGRRLRLP